MDSAATPILKSGLETTDCHNFCPFPYEDNRKYCKGRTTTLSHRNTFSLLRADRRLLRKVEPKKKNRDAFRIGVLKVAETFEGIILK